MKLVIVESPTKAKTIGRFLGPEYTVMSSYGHVRDLPKSKLGIDIEKGFEPQYIIPLKARKRVNELKKGAAKANLIILATDEDREGEAIAWHLSQALGLGSSKFPASAKASAGKQIPSSKKNSKTKKEAEPNKEPAKIERIVFHEITEQAITEALNHPREIRKSLVNAQQGRRVLDRLVGYNLSPFLWKKVARGLSAGRVQSVTLRLIVEREREREAFKPQEYWTVEAMLQQKSQGQNPKSQPFTASLIEKDGKKLEKFDLPNQETANAVTEDLKKANWNVTKVEQKERSLTPPTPYRTSTLQQDAWRRLRFSAKQTMRVAQQLYEGIELNAESLGLITYMRTDSMNLSEMFLDSVQRYLETSYGKDYAAGSRRYKAKARGAQEAHEAIRPTDVERTPESLKGVLEPRAWKLYDLIWKRAVASQMPEARFLQTSISINAKGQEQIWGFRASGSQQLFDGFTRVWEANRENTTLPALSQNDALTCTDVKSEQHFTEPPPRFNEATLIKALEEYGIGRPSTYAPTLSTIQDRNYVEKDESKRLKPTNIGLLVNDLLVEHFPEIVDVAFTAKMEEELDDIAENIREWQSVMRDFWMPFSKHLEGKLDSVERMQPKTIETDEVCEKCGKPMVQKFGRFGPFLACSGFPECRNAKPLKENRLNIKCPKCEKGDVVPRRSKKGKRFFGCDQYPNCDFVAWDKPIDEKCPDCQQASRGGTILTKTFKGLVKCSGKECTYKRQEVNEEESE